MPALQLWEAVTGKPMVIHFAEDNEAALKIIKSGKNPKLRHVGRTHKVDIMFLHETFSQDQMVMHYCDTLKQRADIFTKAFSNPEKWKLATANIGIVNPDMFWRWIHAGKPVTPPPPKRKFSSVGASAPAARFPQPLSEVTERCVGIHT